MSRVEAVGRICVGDGGTVGAGLREAGVRAGIVFALSSKQFSRPHFSGGMKFESGRWLPHCERIIAA